MELLGTVDNPRMAQAFVDYLALRGIDVLVKPIAQDKLELYVDAPFLTPAKAEFATFAQNPTDKKYLDASWSRNSNDNPLTYQSQGNGLLKNWLSHGRWLTHSILFINLAIFALAHVTAIYPMLAFPYDGSLASGEYWRWITPAFMHFSAMHIIFNLLWWWLLGGKLEKSFGSTFLLLFMLFTALISNFAQYITHHDNNFGGLSGVVYALIGFCWLYGRLKQHSEINLSDHFFGFSLFWLVLGFADVLWVNVANQAHLAGLLSGLGFAWIYSRVRVA